MTEIRELNAARAAKAGLRARLAGDPRVNGIGIDTTGAHAAVRVNVIDADNLPDLPDDVDGVPVKVVVVGTIRPHGAT